MQLSWKVTGNRRWMKRLTAVCGIFLAVLVGGVASQPGHSDALTAQDQPHPSRGYLTTPQELQAIRQKADQGIEPYQSAVAQVLEWADREWDYKLDAHEYCGNADRPPWVDNSEGAGVLYAKALAYHLTGDEAYARQVKDALARIMSEVLSITLSEQRCRLVFSWGTPELVASADLIEGYWYDMICTGPVNTVYEDKTLGEDRCKKLFQNWLVKNPYYLASLSAEEAQSNWGAAATNTLAYIADYLWDRPEMILIHRTSDKDDGSDPFKFSPAQAYAHANELALNRMNGYRVELGSSVSCDFLNGEQQDDQWLPVKSQITELGIVPEDARRAEHCNIPVYDGNYQNYPQIHLGNNIQQCELMLRRGDSSCYDNVDNSDIPDYTFTGPDGERKVTHLYPGRGSIERGIKAIIVDSNTEWRHDSALEVAYRYYYNHHTLPGFEEWFQELDRPGDCSQDVCFGTLTHGFAIGETIEPPPTVLPPLDP